MPADINLTNTSKTRLTFQPNDITNKTIKNVSTRDTLTSAVQSLIAGTDIQIQLLVLTLGTNKAVMQAIADTLSSVTAPLDEVLYNTLLMFCIKIGEADVRFTDARCQQSVLVCTKTARWPAHSNSSSRRSPSAVDGHPLLITAALHPLESRKASSSYLIGIETRGSQCVW